MKKVFLNCMLLLCALIVGSSNLWATDPVVLFHETFGNNTGSARAWDNSYSVKSGVSAVYSGITGYTVSNVKQGKNTTGSTGSGLNQSAQGTDAYIIIGPLNVASYNTLTLTYQWKAASIAKTYSTALYYATSSGGAYTEVSGTGTGATTFVERSYSLPAAAQVSTLYLKIVWNTSNTQAIIDEVDLQGISAGGPAKTPCVDAASLTLAPGDFDIKGKRTGTFEASGTKTDEGATFTYSTTATSGLTVASDGSYTASAAGSYTVKVTATPSDENTYSSVEKDFDITLSDTRGESGLAYTPSSYEANLGESFTTPTLTNPNSLSVTYSSSPASVATVNAETGAVTMLKDGTVTITATAEGTNDYKGGSTSYTLTITDPNKKVFDFEQNGNDYGSGVTTTSDGSTYVEVDKTWTIDGVKIVTSGKYRWWNSSGSYTLRFYTNSPQSKMTISAPTGKVLTSISITGGQQFASNDGAYSSSTGKWAGQATSVVLTYNAASGSVNVKTVTVTIGDPTVTVSSALYTTYTTLIPVSFADVTAYTVSSISGSSISLATVKEAPANTPVIIKATAEGTYTLTYKSDAASVGTNLLLASDGTVEGDESTIYALGKKNDVVGFYLVGDGVKVPAGKAYLDLSGITAPSMLRIEDEVEVTTNIENVEASDKAVKFIENGQLLIKRDNVVYDTMGRIIR